MRHYVAQLNPLVLAIVGLSALLSSLFIRDMVTGLLALGCYAVAMVLFLPTWRFPLVCLAFSAFAALTVTYSSWRLGGRDLEIAVTAGMRILVLAWPGSVMAGYVDPGRLGDYLAQNLRLPARGVAAFSASLQQYTGLVTTWNQLETVRRARGAMPGWSPVAIVRHTGAMTFALLVQAMRGATSASIAMDAKGFATAQQRTWAEPATWSRADKIATALALVLAAVAPVLFFLH